MNISFKPSFVKDFKSLPPEIKAEVRKICVGTFPEIKNLYEFQDYPAKKFPDFQTTIASKSAITESA